MQEQEIKELDLIVKADVQGSVEAVRDALEGIAAQEIKVKCIHTGVGGITESDVMLASASRAIIIGFNVRPTPKASQLAEQERIDLRLYTVIYEAIEDVRKAMEGMLAPIEKELVLGRAEVRQTFSISKIGIVAGCYVVSGKIERSNQVRLIRDDVVVYQGRMVSMKRYKDDIKEASEGYECGIVLENYRDVKVGDVVEAFTIEKESAKLT
jgi:translation initiation factor IF-2